MFLTLKEYLLGARKLLAIYGYNCLKEDEDAISYVASYMMKADQTWDGKSSSRDTWRYNQAKFAVMKLKTAHRKKRKLKSLDQCISYSGNRPVFLRDVIVDKEHKKDYQQVHELMLLAKQCLEPRQYQFLNLYYMEHKTLREIGDMFGISRERVRQILEDTKTKLKHECKAESDNFTP